MQLHWCKKNDRSPDTSLSTHSPTIRHRHPILLDLEPSRKDMERELNKVKRLLERSEDSKRCAVCLNNPRTMIVKPCRHYCLCEGCKNKLRKCPIVTVQLCLRKKYMIVMIEMFMCVTCLSDKMQQWLLNDKMEVEGHRLKRGRAQ